MIVRTPSKINLFLRVTGILPGGWHSIETLFLPLAEPHDELELDFSADGRSGLSVTCDHPSVPDGEKNLCWKAVQLVRNALKFTDTVSIKIRKRIPVAGGMAGGSSDAGALIAVLQKCYGALPDDGAAIALACGSDVPLFLNPQISIGRGRGERLTPVEGLKIPEIRILPMNFPVSAKWAYQNMVPETMKDPRALEEMLSALRRGDFRKAGELLRNDLAPAVFRKFPILERTRQLYEAEHPGWKVQLSGSGPTLFALNTASPLSGETGILQGTSKNSFRCLAATVKSPQKGIFRLLPQRVAASNYSFASFSTLSRKSIRLNF